ncbi:MAG TPA: hypothetical protein VNJ09_10860 [Chthonomonadales bacterium]|nr:hypothetical protein [Chthonomonadales bacterium]
MTPVVVQGDPHVEFPWTREPFGAAMLAVFQCLRCTRGLQRLPCIGQDLRRLEAYCNGLMWGTFLTTSGLMMAETLWHHFVLLVKKFQH